MRLLICTQRIDENDSVMGFFVSWAQSFESKINQFNIVCLTRGDHSLGYQVGIFPLSFGAQSRIFKVWRFFYYLFLLRNKYDVVFVHMSKEFIWLGAVWWKLTGKKIIFWYNHPLGGWGARIAGFFADAICYTSPQSYFAKHNKGLIMPVGVDTDIFSPREDGEKKHFAYIGRISPIKAVDLIINSFLSIPRETTKEKIFIYGDSPVRDLEYGRKIEAMATDGSDKVETFPGLPNKDLPRIYRQHLAVVNMTKGGSFDKVIFESMSCGTPVISSNPGYRQLIPAEFHGVLCPKEDDMVSLASCLISFVKLPDLDRNNIGRLSREIVEQYHSLDSLTNKIIALGDHLTKKNNETRYRIADL